MPPNLSELRTSNVEAWGARYLEVDLEPLSMCDAIGVYADQAEGRAIAWAGIRGGRDTEGYGGIRGIRGYGGYGDTHNLESARARFKRRFRVTDGVATDSGRQPGAGTAWTSA